MLKWIVLVIVLVAIGAGVWYWRAQSGTLYTYRTATVEKGNLVATISATGTVEPEEVIDVGAQVAGKINTFGKDPKDPTKFIDYRTEVDEGTILAEIDRSVYQSQLEQAQAQLVAAQVGVQKSKADLEQMRAKLAQATADWKRAESGGTLAGLSQSDLDTYKANYQVASANVSVGEAAIGQANASVLQAQSAVRLTETNLSYCTIKSPVKGVIIDRRVNVGQTVVSSLNAPSLFLIAKDLNRMQVWASVNEADIGHIHPGQPVTFTVDAYPGKTFYGKVGKVRLNATMTSNVVTYTVEVVTDNNDGKLLPYLTANLKFELDRRDNVLMVPATALRWQPTSDQVAPGYQGSEADIPATKDKKPGRGQKPADATIAKVWVQEGTHVKPVEVHPGLSNGSMTEIQANDLPDGTQIVVSAEAASTADSATGNPFIPQFGNRQSRQSAR